MKNKSSILVPIKNRRGSHVGMILSFAVFITFVVFLYSILRPTISTGEDKRPVADNVQRMILKNISANFTSASIQVTENVPENCINVKNLLVIPQFNPPHLIIKNENGITQETYTDYILGLADVMINRGNPSNTFFKIYGAKDFPVLESTDLDCKEISDNDYTIGLIKLDNYVFENRLYKLIDYYNDNYEELKESFNIPPGNEFGFDLVQSNGTLVGVRSGTISGEVYADEVPIQYIDDKANILSGFINIRVW